MRTGTFIRWLAAALVATSVTARAATPEPAVATAPPLVVGVSAEEFLGPLGSWIDARDFGARGDGEADDTKALQRALDELGDQGKGRPAVLYLPAGRYRITRTLELTERRGVSVVGDSPATTAIVWDGQRGGAMLWLNGVAEAQLERLTWDGSGTAGVGVGQWWNHKSVRQWAGSVRHVDEVFTDMAVGIAGGRMDGSNYGSMDSEATVLRSRFVRNTVAGVSTGSFNALDWWVWDSEFENCGRGVTNQYSQGSQTGAGNFAVYRSVFRGSTVADVSIGNTAWFGLYQNVSINSRRFFQAGDSGRNGAEIILVGNRVLDSVEPVAIEANNLGPLIMIDNQIRSRVGASGPAVAMRGSFGVRDLISVGNRYTVPSPVAVREPEKDRLWTIEDRQVERAAISADVPRRAQTPSRIERKVLEVPLGASAKMIQAVIDIAAKMDEVNPVVHLPAGTYHLDRTLRLPAQTRLQLAGDGEATQLIWAGDPDRPMLELAGPSKATVRDVSLLKGLSMPAAGIVIHRADQPGGRVYADRTFMGVVHIKDLQQTQVNINSLSVASGVTVDGSRSVSIIGSSNIAPFRLLNGARLLVADSWFEGPVSDLISGDSGDLTWIGGSLAPSDVNHGGKDSRPGVHVDGFDGRISLVGLSMWLQKAENGIRIGHNKPSSAVLLLGIRGSQPGYYIPAPPGAAASGGSVTALSLHRHAQDGTYSMPDNSRPRGNEGVLAGLAALRQMVWEQSPYTAPSGATDVRLYRVKTVDTRSVGLLVKAD